MLVLTRFSLLPLQGTTCDVREGQDVKDLVSFAQKELKYIDIWVLTSDPFLYHTQAVDGF